MHFEKIKMLNLNQIGCDVVIDVISNDWDVSRVLEFFLEKFPRVSFKRKVQSFEVLIFGIASILIFFVFLYLLAKSGKEFGGQPRGIPGISALKLVGTGIPGYKLYRTTVVYLGNVIIDYVIHIY